MRRCIISVIVYIGVCASLPAAASDGRLCNSARCALSGLSNASEERWPVFLHARSALDDVKSLSPSERDLFWQFYGTAAMLLGDYKEADDTYKFFKPPVEVSNRLYKFPRPAVDIITARAARTSAVFVNESHGNAKTRLGLFTLLPELKRLGFKYLALETAAVSGSDGDTIRCHDVGLSDSQLEQRGYAIAGSGYYSREPIYGETIEYALELGFRIVGYDIAASSQTMRMKGGAATLSCLMKRDPSAKIVVLGGFGNIGESPKTGEDRYTMADWFRKLSGIDPLTISTNVLLGANAVLDNELARLTPGALYVLSDSDGAIYKNPAYDVSVVIAGSSRRGARDNWLTMGGRRGAVEVSASGCRRRRPCLMVARKLGRPEDAVPSDSCVVYEGVGECVLYLSLGHYTIAFIDSTGKVLNTTTVPSPLVASDHE